ncbi:MAG: hypothetical protein ACREDY_17510, partial [Bradyrhizobium sp.]
MPWGVAAAGIGGIASIFGAGQSANASKQAAQIQANATNKATDLQQAEFQQTQNNLQPYLNQGYTAQNILGNYLGIGPGGSFNGSNAFLLQNPMTLAGQSPVLANLPNAPQFNEPAFTQQQFQQSPGYQYQLGQGQQAVQNSAAGQSGALSGNMLRGLQQNATGLANQDWWNSYNAYNQNYLNTYNAQNQQYQDTQGYLGNAYQQWLSSIGGQQSNIYNMLAGLSGSGQNAAANLGGLGTNVANSIGQNTIGAGNAQAAGVIGSSNALVGGVNGLTNNLLSPNMGNSSLASALQNIFGAGGTGGTDTGGQDFYGGQAGP